VDEGFWAAWETGKLVRDERREEEEGGREGGREEER
jgi:hypothetical protein